MPKIDYGNCYSKVKGNLSPPSNDSIIIALVERSNGQKKSSVSYTFYHPETGKKIDADSICKDEEVYLNIKIILTFNAKVVFYKFLFLFILSRINIHSLR